MKQWRAQQCELEMVSTKIDTESQHLCLSSDAQTALGPWRSSAPAGACAERAHAAEGQLGSGASVLARADAARLSAESESDSAPPRSFAFSPLPPKVPSALPDCSSPTLLEPRLVKIAELAQHAGKLSQASCRTRSNTSSKCEWLL